MLSNLSVGLPLDIVVARRDALAAELNYRIEPGEPYFHDLRERWSAALRAAPAPRPRPPRAAAELPLPSLPRISAFTRVLAALCTSAFTRVLAALWEG